MSVSVYASVDDLKNRITPGQTLDSVITDRMTAALINGSRYVDGRLDNPFSDEPIAAPYTVAVVPCDPRWRSATIAAAMFFYKLDEAPFGVLGGWEYAVRLRMEIPQVDAILGTATWNIG